MADAEFAKFEQDFEAQFADNEGVATLVRQVAKASGATVVEHAATRVDKLPHGEEEIVDYGLIADRIGKARIGTLRDSYFRIPHAGEGAILEAMAGAYTVKFDDEPREMLRITFSTKSFDEDQAEPLTVVEDYLVDFNHQCVYVFGGAITGEAGEGDTIHDVKWNVKSYSPPETEYDVEKGTSTVYNELYEENIVYEITAGEAQDGSKSLFDKLLWLIDYPKEPVSHFDKEYQRQS